MIVTPWKTPWKNSCARSQSSSVHIFQRSSFYSWLFRCRPGCCNVTRETAAAFLLPGPMEEGPSLLFLFIKAQDTQLGRTPPTLEVRNLAPFTETFYLLKTSWVSPNCFVGCKIISFWTGVMARSRGRKSCLPKIYSLWVAPYIPNWRYSNVYSQWREREMPTLTPKGCPNNRWRALKWLPVPLVLVLFVLPWERLLIGLRHNSPWRISAPQNLRKLCITEKIILEVRMNHNDNI